jgi:hypothetical protein
MPTRPDALPSRPIHDREDPAMPACSISVRRSSVRRSSVRRSAGSVRKAGLGAALLLALIAVAPRAAGADEHDPKRSAHPLRVLAYAVHPIGVALDWLIVRPAHWVVEREPFRTIFGHEN